MTSDATGLPLAEPAADRIVVSWDELDALVAALAEHVGRDYDLVLAITRGGLVPAGILAYRLDLREILVAGVEFYTAGGATHEAPRFGHFPDADLLAGRRILVVDEVWETGETMAAVARSRSRCRWPSRDRRHPLQAGPFTCGRGAGSPRRAGARVGDVPVQGRAAGEREERASDGGRRRGSGP